MNSHPSQAAAAASVEAETPLADRVAALELLVQNLVFVLDAQGALNADAFADWLDTAVGRMHATRSVPAAEANALQTLAREVMR